MRTPRRWGRGDSLKMRSLRVQVLRVIQVCWNNGVFFKVTPSEIIYLSPWLCEVLDIGLQVWASSWA